MPASQAGRRCAVAIKVVGPFSPYGTLMGEVVRMWKKRIAAVLQVLAYMALILYVMTIDVC